MKKYKQFVIGMLAGALIFGAAPAYAETQKMVNAIFGQVKLILNGQNVDKETVLIDGSTYVPLRAIGEMLNLEVGWDEKTSTASLTNKPDATTAVPATPEPTSANSKTPVTVDQFQLDFNILPPDIIGVIYIEAVYKNNSSYPIKELMLISVDKVTGEKNYLASYDTVMPGETSPKFDTFGPKSGKMADIEFLETIIQIAEPNGDTTYIEYDHKLKTYEVIYNY